MSDKKLEYLLDVAIKNEEDAYNFYMDLQNRVSDKEIKIPLNSLLQKSRNIKNFWLNIKMEASAPGHLNWILLLIIRLPSMPRSLTL